LQVIPPDETQQTITNFVNVLLGRVREARAAQQGEKTAQHTPIDDGSLAITPLLKRLDVSLVRENAALLMQWAGLRSDSMHQALQTVGELIRPIFGYRFLFCAFVSGEPGVPGTLLIDQNDPSQATSALAMLGQLEEEVRRAARRHKDLPEKFERRFSRDSQTADDAERISLDQSAQYATFPIEEGPKLYGVFGIAYDGKEPSGDERQALGELVPMAFSALSGAWQRYQLSQVRDKDELTGLWRRATVLEYLRLALRNSNSIEEPFSLLLLDVDGLDRFNDSLGFEGGDRLLREAGNLLRRLGPGNWRAGRVGDDELLLIMPGAKISEAMKVAKSLQTQFSQIRLGIGENPHRITVSMGISFRALEERPAEYLLRNARNGLGAVKAGGGNGIRASG